MITETTSPNGREQAALCSSALLAISERLKTQDNRIMQSKKLISAEEAATLILKQYGRSLEVLAD